MAINIKKTDLIYPYFVIDGKNKKEEIKSFPDIYRFSIDRLLKDIAESRALGIKKILLFGIPKIKDNKGSSSYGSDNITARAIQAIKKDFKDMTIITDVCLCAYTTHGHCGIIKAQSSKLKAQNKFQIDNTKTLKILSKIALSHAQAGADIVAPSAMAKGQVAAIRSALDKNGFRKTKIMGYSAKFHSNFYGPFRQAAKSAPKFGDRSGYQLAFNDSRVALREIVQDIKEGADIVMVKPALSYLDIIKEASEKFKHSLAAYNVSGEYAMVKAYCHKSLPYEGRQVTSHKSEKKLVFEILTAIKRAGANFIISYHAKDVAKWLNEQK